MSSDILLKDLQKILAVQFYTISQKIDVSPTYLFENIVYADIPDWAFLVELLN